MSVGDVVGAAEGAAVGAVVGVLVGAIVGAAVGSVVGTGVGKAVGSAVGAAVCSAQRVHPSPSTSSSENHVISVSAATMMSDGKPLVFSQPPSCVLLLRPSPSVQLPLPAPPL